jgi:hypothetical protein
MAPIHESSSFNTRLDVRVTRSGRVDFHKLIRHVLVLLTGQENIQNWTTEYFHSMNVGGTKALGKSDILKVIMLALATA